MKKIMPGERLKQRMREMGISQTQLAEEIRRRAPKRFATIDQSGISHFCRGLVVHPAWLHEAAMVLQTSYEWILHGADTVYAKPAAKKGLGDSGRSAGRRDVFEMLDKWENWTEAQQEEFLAIALIHRKKVE